MDIRFVIFSCIVFFFFNDTATTEIYTLSLHDALPISQGRTARPAHRCAPRCCKRATCRCNASAAKASARSEEHTSELQSRQYLVCRLLLEKKKRRRSGIHNEKTTASEWRTPESGRYRT